MSGKGEGDSRVPAAPIGIVRGGTTTGWFDNEQRRMRADADRRRAHQDNAYRIQETARQRGDFAKLGSLRMLDRGSPRLVLSYMNGDGTVRQECKSELTTYAAPDMPGGIDLCFAMVCPKCLERGVSQGNAQMLIKNAHRKFWVDERRKGQVYMLEYSWGFRENVILAGTVTVQDIVRCDNGCGYAVRIDDSKVWEV